MNLVKLIFIFTDESLSDGRENIWFLFNSEFIRVTYSNYNSCDLLPNNLLLNVHSMTTMINYIPVY